MKRSGKIFFYSVCLMGGLILSACSNGISPASADSILNAPTGDSPICHTGVDPTAQSYLDNFPMLNQQGQPGPAVSAGVSGYPFGALVNFTNDGSGSISYCTVTHMAPGNVLTAAHCVEGDADPSDYYILFYGTNGQRRISRIYTWWKGSSDNVDAAVLRVCPDGYNNWDTAGTDLYKSSGIAQSPAQAFNVQVWAYDPIKNYPNIYQAYGNHAGMLFPGPKTFAASRTVPQVYGYDQSGNNTGAITSSKVNANIHVMMDNGQIPLVSGNSGSLITLAGILTAKSVSTIGEWDQTILRITARFGIRKFGNSQWISSAFSQTYYQVQMDLEFYQVGSVFDAFTN